jgi:hypothetical protein
MEIKTTNYGICTIKRGNHPNNGNMWLQIVDKTGQPVQMITKNIIPLAEDEFCANYYNMSATLWNDVVASGLFEITKQFIPCGFCEYPVCKLVKQLA